MTTHREQPGVTDGVCVDCERFYYCSIREAAETERHSHVVECGQFVEDTGRDKNKIAQ